jgi:hypothetical protein
MRNDSKNARMQEFHKVRKESVVARNAIALKSQRRDDVGGDSCRNESLQGIAWGYEREWTPFLHKYSLMQ